MDKRFDRNDFYQRERRGGARDRSRQTKGFSHRLGAEGAGRDPMHEAARTPRRWACG